MREDIIQIFELMDFDQLEQLLHIFIGRHKDVDGVACVNRWNRYFSKALRESNPVNLKLGYTMLHAWLAHLAWPDQFRRPEILKGEKA